MAYHPPHSVFLAHDVVGPVEVSTIAEYRGDTLCHFETAVLAGAPWVVVDTWFADQAVEALAAHEALVASLSALSDAS